VAGSGRICVAVWRGVVVFVSPSDGKWSYLCHQWKLSTRPVWLRLQSGLYNGEHNHHPSRRVIDYQVKWLLMDKLVWSVSSCILSRDDVMIFCHNIDTLSYAKQISVCENMSVLIRTQAHAYPPTRTHTQTHTHTHKNTHTCNWTHPEICTHPDI
jgi:hypothetical protein